MCLQLCFVSDFILFFFKQKTAYEMRISDWSSDVCSSDLPGTATWFSGLPGGVQEFDLKPKSFKAGESIHGWWWPAERKNAPAILYLHGVRWNLTGQLFRIRQLRALGFSVLAIDYRGFGKSQGDLPSEASVYEDAKIGRAH